MKIFFVSKYVSFLIISALIFFLFSGIFKTYAYTDGYEFLWNSTENDFFTVFIQQGRALSGWIITHVFSSLNHISDYSKIRFFNMICLLIAAFIVFKILLRNNLNNFHALIIVLVFLCSPYASIIVHWEATSSCIWGLPISLMSGELIFMALLKNENNENNFLTYLIVGIILGIAALFIYQPAFTSAIFPAFVYFVTSKKTKLVWKHIAIYFSIFIIYFILFKIQLFLLNIPPSDRAGIVVDTNKLVWFLKGALINSFQYSLIIGSSAIINAVKIAALLLIVFYIYKQNKMGNITNPTTFILYSLMLYILAYLPSFIAADNWISYRTTNTIALFSSTLLILSLLNLPLKPLYNNLIVGIITAIFIGLAYTNNSVFTSIASHEYEASKKIISEKLNQSYPDSITVIMPEENFLVTERKIKNIVTDEFGKLSNSVYWGAATFTPQLIYDITGDRARAKKIKMNYYYRKEFIDKRLNSDRAWILDYEKIYLENL